MVFVPGRRAAVQAVNKKGLGFRLLGLGFRVGVCFPDAWARWSMDSSTAPITRCFGSQA